MPKSSLESALQDRITAAQLEPDIPLAMAIQVADQVVYYDAPATSGSDQKIGRSTLLYAASLAKQITGACVALAMKDGSIAFNDTLAPWFPDLPDWASGVEVSHLLSHTAALPEETAVLERMRDSGETARTSDRMLAALQDFEVLNETPGSTFSYSNMGYVCLARLVELATDEPLVDFAARRIFEPLGMTSTCFWPGPNAIPDGAVPVEDEPIVGQPFSLGDGGLWTTVDDFLCWLDAMNSDLLGISSMVEQTVALNDGSPLDYGWGIRRIEQDGVVGWSHGGSWPGIVSKSVRFPELRASFVAFSLDSDTCPILRLTDQIQGLLVGRARQ